MSLKGFDLEIFCKSAMETLFWCLNDTGITVALYRILFSLSFFLTKSCTENPQESFQKVVALNTATRLSTCSLLKIQNFDCLCSFQEEARRVALKQRAEQNVHTETLGWEEEEEGAFQTSREHCFHTFSL